MKKTFAAAVSAVLLASSYAHADTLCTTGTIAKLFIDKNGVMEVTVGTLSYLNGNKDAYSLLTSAYLASKQVYIYAPNCQPGTSMGGFAVR
ncbi:hypothetical protein [Burkholderia thailandensis]|uniref:Lipoprotein n=1 Tax=Burkholderia thailandensis (strain ATCC 700388 / DSM 13276 / CCUG 48851 / CIP 106301 / E264) TaxID=271848 RepID=Q2SX86_BURTA|nr:hypothetical protein [Burkholderia thailandensis]ABC37429.1 conserved hypothetical protein [Burkholderia thailandensis E264]AHI74708.1 hypothetical protein BTQ_1977 [Burkholderia thailandensis 2002721723]AHI79520.1 hypothetical protein BTJ_377 [Burkholderia thailandensis E444]AIC85765.1 hypothetical protein BTRA_1897 [Burkholderia thailandensis USAMRU Malaysia \